jgi:hypothetical protein
MPLLLESARRMEMGTLDGEQVVRGYPVQSPCSLYVVFSKTQIKYPASEVAVIARPLGPRRSERHQEFLERTIDSGPR